MVPGVNFLPGSRSQLHSESGWLLTTNIPLLYQWLHLAWAQHWVRQLMSILSHPPVPCTAQHSTFYRAFCVSKPKGRSCLVSSGMNSLCPIIKVCGFFNNIVLPLNVVGNKEQWQYLMFSWTWKISHDFPHWWPIGRCPMPDTEDYTLKQPSFNVVTATVSQGDVYVWYGFNKRNWEDQNIFFLTAFVKLLLAPVQQKPLTCGTSLFVFSGNEIFSKIFWKWKFAPFHTVPFKLRLNCKNELLVVKIYLPLFNILTLFLCWIQRTLPALLQSVLLILPDSTQ